MPYVTDGQGRQVWKPEDDDVQTAVAKVTDAGGPLMQRAATQGATVAKRRGLMNSSMAVESAQAAVLDKAVAIGGQQSQQTFTKNLSLQQYGQESQLSQQRSAEEMERLQTQIRSTEGIATADRTSRESLTREGYTNDLTISREGNVAAGDRLDRQLGSNERVAAGDRTSREGIAAADRDTNAALTREG